MDESTSNLDFRTENLIFKMIYEELTDRTMLIIAHRLSTIRHCDEILLLDKGEISERGTHDELITLQGKYFELWEMQQGNMIGIISGNIGKVKSSTSHDQNSNEDEMKYT